MQKLIKKPSSRKLYRYRTYWHRSREKQYAKSLS